MLKTIKFISLIALTIAIIANLNWLKSPIAGLILGILYLVIFGYLIGRLIFQNKDLGWQIIFGSMAVVSSFSLLGAIVYYFYQLNQISVSLLFAIISTAIIILNTKFRNSAFGLRNLNLNLKSVIGNPQSVILTITYLILFTIAIITLFSSQTTDAIRSPWQIIPKAFFIIYFLATLNLLLFLFRNQQSAINNQNSIPNVILISFHFFLTTSVALIIYKLGYGFDPFIHQVTELAIFQNGYILPKPFYYLGQYSLVIILSHLLQISVEWVDKLLLPILMAIFLPYTIYKSLALTFDWQKNRAQLLTLIFLIIPFSLFIATTPQALANIFSIIIIFLSFLYIKEKQIPFWYLIILTLVSLSIHALAGLPILIYLIILWLIQKNNLAAKIILPIFVMLSGLALPLALITNSFISIYKAQITQTTDFIGQLLPNLFNQQYWYFLDLAYLYKYSIYPLILVVTLLTLYNIIKNHKTKTFFSAILTFLVLITNAVLLNFIKISFIIDYEQGEFSKRVAQLAFYFLLPIVIYGLYLFLEKTEVKPFFYKSFIILLLSSLLSLSLYQSYPRFDNYNNSKFINLSADDLSAVNFIEKNSEGKNYIVLANQTTSAAALKTFGFTKYYNGQFFYPIPTGGELYKYFEKMIYEKADRKTMLEAMDFSGVEIAYFVLPTFWSNFEVINNQAQASADKIFSVADKILIFKYIK